MLPHLERMLFAANWGGSQQKWNKSLSSNILTWKDFSEGADIRVLTWTEKEDHGVGVWFRIDFEGASSV